jgi:hypothetical protein
MNKRFSILLFFVLMAVEPVFAQTTLFKWNFISPVVNTLNLAIENSHSPEASTQLRVFYMSFDGIKGFGVNPEYRYYLSDSPAPNGAFVAPYIRYMRFSDEFDRVNVGEFGFTIGKQRVYKEKISFEIYAGPGYVFSSMESSGIFEDGPVGGGFTIRAGLTIGIALNRNSHAQDRPGRYDY